MTWNCRIRISFASFVILTTVSITSPLSVTMILGMFVAELLLGIVFMFSSRLTRVSLRTLAATADARSYYLFNLKFSALIACRSFLLMNFLPFLPFLFSSGSSFFFASSEVYSVTVSSADGLAFDLSSLSGLADVARARGDDWIFLMAFIFLSLLSFCILGIVLVFTNRLLCLVGIVGVVGFIALILFCSSCCFLSSTLASRAETTRLICS